MNQPKWNPWREHVWSGKKFRDSETPHGTVNSICLRCGVGYNAVMARRSLWRCRFSFIPKQADSLTRQKGE